MKSLNITKLLKLKQGLRQRVGGEGITDASVIHYRISSLISHAVLNATLDMPSVEDILWFQDNTQDYLRAHRVSPR